MGMVPLSAEEIRGSPHGVVPAASNRHYVQLGKKDVQTMAWSRRPRPTVLLLPSCLRRPPGLLHPPIPHFLSSDETRIERGDRPFRLFPRP